MKPNEKAKAGAHMTNRQNSTDPDARLAFEPLVRPFRVEYQDMPCVVWAASAGRARYLAAASLHDAGYLNRANPAAVRAIRERSLDHLRLAVPGRCYAYDQLPSA